MEGQGAQSRATLLNVQVSASWNQSFVLIFFTVVIQTVFYLFQPSPRSLLHVDSSPQNMVERGQEVMTDVQGKLLNGLYLQ